MNLDTLYVDLGVDTRKENDSRESAYMSKIKYV